VKKFELVMVQIAKKTARNTQHRGVCTANRHGNWFRTVIGLKLQGMGLGAGPKTGRTGSRLYKPMNRFMPHFNPFFLSLRPANPLLLTLEQTNGEDEDRCSGAVVTGR
jgi:hypothetical protein